MLLKSVTTLKGPVGPLLFAWLEAIDKMFFFQVFVCVTDRCCISKKNRGGWIAWSRRVRMNVAISADMPPPLGRRKTV